MHRLHSANTPKEEEQQHTDDEFTVRPNAPKPFVSWLTSSCFMFFFVLVDHQTGLLPDII